MTSAELIGLNVLVAEDEYFTAFDVCNALEEMGITVLGPVSSLSEGMRILDQKHHVDIAVLDVKLRDGFVYDLADAIAAGGIYIIFLTAYDREEVAKRYPDVPILDKPVDYGALRSALLGSRIFRVNRPLETEADNGLV